MALRKIFLCVIALLIITAGCSNRSDQDTSGSTGENQIERKLDFTREVVFLDAETQQDTITTIRAAIADSQMEQNEGLMNVSKLPADRGMLFIFKEQKPRSFWMANTPLPLDILFLNSDKKIIRIHHSAQPYSEKRFPSGKPAQYVVETNGGFCINHDIHEGMYVTF